MGHLEGHFSNAQAPCTFERWTSILINKNTKFLALFFWSSSKKEAWRRKLSEAHQVVLDYDKDDEVNIDMAFKQLHDFIDMEPPQHEVASNSYEGNNANIDKINVIMDK